MPITRVGAAGAVSNNVTTLTLTHGLTILEGDQILFLLNADNTIANRASVPTVTAVIRDVNELSGHTWTARKTATASEPSSYTVTFTTGERATLQIAVFRGVDQTTPLNGNNSNNGGLGLTGTFTSLLPTVDGCAVVCWIATQEGNSSSTNSFNNWPATTTERADHSSPGAGSGAKSSGFSDVIQTTAAAVNSTVTILHPDTTNWGCHIYAFNPASGDQNIAVGQASETNLAQSIVVATTITIALGLVTESDIAQAITPLQQISIPVDQVLEVDLAQPVTTIFGGVDIVVPQSLETDLAQSITPNQSTQVAVTQSQETDIAQSISPILGGVSILLDQVVETDLSQSISVLFAQQITANQVIEVDLSQPVSVVFGGVFITVNQAAEVDLAQPVDLITGVSITLGQALESNIAQSIPVLLGVTNIPLGQSSETDIAQSITPVIGDIVTPIGQIVETDIAQIISLNTANTISVDQAIEADAAQVIAATVPSAVTVNQAIEVDLAQVIALIFGTVIVSDDHTLIAPAPSRTLTAGTPSRTISIESPSKAISAEEP